MDCSRSLEDRPPDRTSCYSREFHIRSRILEEPPCCVLEAAAKRIEIATA